MRLAGAGGGGGATSEIGFEDAERCCGSASSSSQTHRGFTRLAASLPAVI